MKFEELGMIALDSALMKFADNGFSILIKREDTRCKRYSSASGLDLQVNFMYYGHAARNESAYHFRSGYFHNERQVSIQILEDLDSKFPEILAKGKEV